MPAPSTARQGALYRAVQHGGMNENESFVVDVNAQLPADSSQLFSEEVA